jgi:SAM-dependent methyltransferase
MKSIDFDPVADLYDVYVRTDADHPFWCELAAANPPLALELMCGTGRIALALLRAKLPVEGLDYSRGLLGCFRDKLRREGLATALHQADARDFATGKRYGLVYIGFNAIAEVLADDDKCRVFSCVGKHLLPGGQFWLTVHNPPIRRKTLDGHERPLGDHLMLPGGESLNASARFLLDVASGQVTGEQRFVVTKEGKETRRIVQPVRFHLIPPEQLEALLVASGFRIEQRLGNYDGAAFNPETSPYCILGCRDARP